MNKFVDRIEDDSDSHARNFNLIAFIVRLINIHLLDDFVETSGVKVVFRNVKDLTLGLFLISL